MVSHPAVIYYADHGVHVEPIERTGRYGSRTTFVAVPDQSAAAAVAVALVDDDGVEIIELYRGIGPAATAEVIDAVGDRVPVGSVFYEGPARRSS